MNAPEAPEKRFKVTRLLLSQVRAHTRCRDDIHGNRTLSTRARARKSDLDATLDQIAAQAPANNGTLSATGKLTVDTGEAAGLDIYSTLRGGITVRNQAFAVLTVNGALGFYSVNLLTGKAEFEDNFKSTDQVVDIAIPLNQR
jgi:hypothetical protein